MLVGSQAASSPASQQDLIFLAQVEKTSQILRIWLLKSKNAAVSLRISMRKKHLSF